MKFANLWGKKFPTNHEGFPAALGLHPSMVMEKVIKFLRLADPATSARYAQKFESELAVMRKTETGPSMVVPRTPTFCPGCPHRDSASVLLDVRKRFMDAGYMKKHHHCKPMDIVFHGDTGCYSMLLFPPNEPLMHNYSGMGLCRPPSTPRWATCRRTSPPGPTSAR
jgi:indolepyruvate ferredoxin oxidoreductase